MFKEKKVDTCRTGDYGTPENEDIKLNVNKIDGLRCLIISSCHEYNTNKLKLQVRVT